MRDWQLARQAVWGTAVVLIAIVYFCGTADDFWSRVSTAIFAILSVALLARIWYLALVEYSIVVQDAPDDDDACRPK